MGTMYAQANIGRNVSQDSPLTAASWSGESEPRPMRRGSWESFTHSVGLALASSVGHPAYDGTGATPYEVHNGLGEWEGVTEESRHVSAYSDASYIDGAWPTLAHRLAGLARTYGQKFIFVVFVTETGTISEMVEATK